MNTEKTHATHPKRPRQSPTIGENKKKTSKRGASCSRSLPLLCLGASGETWCSPIRLLPKPARACKASPVCLKQASRTSALVMRTRGKIDMVGQQARHCRLRGVVYHEKPGATSCAELDPQSSRVLSNSDGLCSWELPTPIYDSLHDTHDSASSTKACNLSWLGDSCMAERQPRQ